MPLYHDPIRHERVSETIYADANDDEEIAMRWYYYFAENFEFPADAVAMLKMRGGKQTATQVHIIGVEDSESDVLRLEVCTLQSTAITAITPNQILNIATNEASLEILNDWLYMHDFDVIL